MRPELVATRRRYFTLATVLVLGVASLALLISTQILSERQTRQELLLESALARVEVTTATSHLWLEEHLSGDPTIEVDDIWYELDHAAGMMQVLLRGGRLRFDTEQVEPLRRDDLRRRAERLRDGLLELRKLSVKRHLDKHHSGSGSTRDQSYDEVFNRLLTESGDLRALLAERWTVHQAANRQRLFLAGGIWVLLVVAAVGGLWRYETGRQRVEKALYQRELELREAQKMEAVGRLAGGIAHDVNNYLGAIRGYCEIAKMKGETGEALNRRLDGAIETTRSISSLVQQLLAFSRRQPADPEVLDLNEVVRGLGSMARRLLGEDVTLETDFEEDLRTIEIDLSQVEQILVNLLVNARDAMPQGGRITVRTRNALRNGTHYVVLEVADTGEGIRDEDREKIFEPFFTTKTESERSGLGLATVYGVVRQYGGFISVESELGCGTAFSIHLPASDKPLPEPVQPVAKALPPVEPAKILLVEDNAAMRAATREMLETLGHEVLVADGGEEALRLFADGGGEDADLVISDVVMPGLSGQELMERLRESRSDLPCLFISGYADDVTLRHGFSQERVNFLAKPFDAHCLAKKIATILAEEPGVLARPNL